MPARMKGEIVYRRSPHPGTLQQSCIFGGTSRATERSRVPVLALLGSLGYTFSMSCFLQPSVSLGMGGGRRQQ